jgi:regulator of cell morphogenesis and NO signaling
LSFNFTKIAQKKHKKTKMSSYNFLFVSLQKKKTMKLSLNSMVGEIVKLNFKTSSLFQVNNIDYCCGGNKSIADACKEAGINPGQLIAELETLVAQKDPDSEYINDLGLEELSNYIVKRHHMYVRENIPILKKNLEKICQVHGDYHPELYKINELFTVSAGNLTMHMQKEEQELFPYLQRLESAKKENSPLPGAPFGSVSSTIGMMVSEHQDEGERFDEISRLSKNYQLPEDACSTYEVTFNQLRAFEEDLHRHIHLENNILFPKAIELEK